MRSDFRNAYLAGVLDAKGQILRRGREPNVLYVRLKDTRRELLSQFADAFGGSLWTEKNTSQFARTKPIWTWELRGAAAEEMIGRLLPMLLTRAPEFETRLRECRTGRDAPS